MELATDEAKWEEDVGNTQAPRTNGFYTIIHWNPSQGIQATQVLKAFAELLPIAADFRSHVRRLRDGRESDSI